MLGIAIDRGGIEIGGGCNEGDETDGGRVVSPCEKGDSGLVSCISLSSSAENFLFIFHKRKRSKSIKGGEQRVLAIQILFYIVPPRIKDPRCP